MNFYSRYNPPPQVLTKLDYDTKFVSQSEADMVSLQAQLHRFGVDGLLSKLAATQDKFGYADTRLIPSYSALMNKIADGNSYFMSLPSSIRREFNDDSSKFYDYCYEHSDDAVKRGFITDLKAKQIKEDLGFVKSDFNPSDLDVSNKDINNISNSQQQKNDVVVETSKKSEKGEQK